MQDNKGIVFELGQIIFSALPVAMFLLGGIAPIYVFTTWYLDQQIVLSDAWMIAVGIFLIMLGFQWDDLIIDHYPTSVARKKNSNDS